MLIWEAQSRTIDALAFSPDGRALALAGKYLALGGCKRFYLLTTGGTVIASVADRALSSGAFALAFAPDGRTVVFTAGRDLFVWNTDAARESHRAQLDAKYFLDAAFT